MIKSLNIKKKLVSAALLAASIGSIGIAHAGDDDKPWYIGGSINASDIGDINTTSTAQLAGVSRTIDIGNDDDIGFGIKVGKVITKSTNGNEFNLELSHSEVNNDTESLVFNGNSFVGAAVEGQVETRTTLLRALYKFETGAIDPYIGLGLGQTDLDVDVRYGGSVGTNTGSQPPFTSGGDSVFAIQYRIGGEWGISEKVGVFLEYTRTEVDDVDFSRIGGGPGGLATTTQTGDFEIDSVNIGVNFRF